MEYRRSNASSMNSYSGGKCWLCGCPQVSRLVNLLRQLSRVRHILQGMAPEVEVGTECMLRRALQPPQQRQLVLQGGSTASHADAGQRCPAMPHGRLTSVANASKHSAIVECVSISIPHRSTSESRCRLPGPSG